MKPLPGVMTHEGLVMADGDSNQMGHNASPNDLEDRIDRGLAVEPEYGKCENDTRAVEEEAVLRNTGVDDGVVDLEREAEAGLIVDKVSANIREPDTEECLGSDKAPDMAIEEAGEDSAGYGPGVNAGGDEPLEVVEEAAVVVVDTVRHMDAHKRTPEEQD